MPEKKVPKRYSPAAAAVAREVIAKVVRGEKIVMGQIIKNHGYSDTMATKPGKITKQPSFKAEIDPFVQKLIVERDRAVNLMKKKISKAKYRDLTDGLDKMTKNIQLLTGGQTENTGIEKYVEGLNALMAKLNKK